MAEPGGSVKEELAQTVASLEAAAQRVSNALEYAYTGSAEDGSFLRGTRNEYVPSAFVSMNQLNESIAELKQQLAPEKSAK